MAQNVADFWIVVFIVFWPFAICIYPIYWLTDKYSLRIDSSPGAEIFICLVYTAWLWILPAMVLGFILAIILGVITIGTLPITLFAALGYMVFAACKKLKEQEQSA